MPDQDLQDSEIRLAAFNQNHEAFRSLNQQMWQIPLIAMTLTGGLWFGVSRPESEAIFSIALLGLAGIANVVFILVLYRLRYVMEKYLAWLEAEYPAGSVAAGGNNFFNRRYIVRWCFQLLLGLAAVVSFALMIMYGCKAYRESNLSIEQENSALGFYHRHAADLADGYEALSFEAAHPDLVRFVEEERPGQTLAVLDVGAGTGRDAAWLASRGHAVVAVEPSEAMQSIGKRLHGSDVFTWRYDSLPDLSETRRRGQMYDLILLSAVWMHLSDAERSTALHNIYALLKPGGMAYFTLRIGPEEPSRGIYRVSLEDFQKLAADLSMPTVTLSPQSDLLGRKHITWQSIRIDKPTGD